MAAACDSEPRKRFTAVNFVTRKDFSWPFQKGYAPICSECALGLFAIGRNANAPKALRGSDSPVCKGVGETNRARGGL